MVYPAPDTHFNLSVWRHPARPGGTTDVKPWDSSHGDVPTTKLVAAWRGHAAWRGLPLGGDCRLAGTAAWRGLVTPMPGVPLGGDRSRQCLACCLAGTGHANVDAWWGQVTPMPVDAVCVPKGQLIPARGKRSAAPGWVRPLIVCPEWTPHAG